MIVILVGVMNRSRAYMNPSRQLLNEMGFFRSDLMFSFLSKAMFSSNMAEALLTLAHFVILKCGAYTGLHSNDDVHT